MKISFIHLIRFRVDSARVLQRFSMNINMTLVKPHADYTVSSYSNDVVCVLPLVNHVDCYVWIRRKNLWLFVFDMHLIKAYGNTADKRYVQGRIEWGEGSIILRAPNHCGGRREVPTMSVLCRKYLRFKHWGAKLTFCPGSHLTSLRPWICTRLAAVHSAWGDLVGLDPPKKVLSSPKLTHKAL